MRLRAYLLVTLADIGFPRSAMPSLVDTLAHVEEVDGDRAGPGRTWPHGLAELR